MGKAGFGIIEIYFFSLDSFYIPSEGLLDENNFIRFFQILWKALICSNAMKLLWTFEKYMHQF